MYDKLIHEIENYGDLKDKTLYECSTGSSYELSFLLTGHHIKLCFHQGDCDEDIRRVLELPEIKAQVDKFSDDEINRWWDEFFCDDTDEEHANATKERKLSWALFDAAANAVDGYCYEYQSEKQWFVTKEVCLGDGDPIYLVEPCDSEETAQEVAKFLFADFLSYQNKIAKEFGSDSDWEIIHDTPGYHFATSPFNENILVEVCGKTQIDKRVLEFYKQGLLPSE